MLLLHVCALHPNLYKSTSACFLIDQGNLKIERIFHPSNKSFLFPSTTLLHKRKNITKPL